MNPSQFQQIQAYPHIKGQIASTIDLFISDVRSILQLPLHIIREMTPRQGVTLIALEGGCNFLSCTAMLDIIAGISVCLYFRNSRIGFETDNDRGDRFRDLLVSYYPWNFETLDSMDVSRVLWKYLRNPLVHNLGILPFRGTTVSNININRIQINKSPMDYQEVIQLESISRPMELSSAFDLDHSIFNVNIPPLYWGLHQLLRNLFSDATQMNLVETWYGNQFTGIP
jgi:hypothetical protein